MCYAPSSGEAITNGGDAARYFTKSAEYMLRLAENLTRVMSPEAQELAVGPSGHPGDPAAIAHLAKRWNDIYEGLMDAAEKLRGASVPRDFKRAAELLASFSESPVAAYREFVDDLVAQNDRLPERIAAGEPVKLQMTLKFDIEPEKISAFSAELARIRKAQSLSADSLGA